MDRSMIETRLHSVFISVLKIPESKLPMNPSMETVAEWDSLTHLRLIMSIEQEFGLTFETEKIPLLTSFSDFVEEIENVC